MTHRTALRNSVLCAIAVVAIAGCGAPRIATNAGSTASNAPASGGVTSIAPAPASTPVPDTTGINQQISDINSQIGSVTGQLNAADTGLSTSEGDPSQ